MRCDDQRQFFKVYAIAEEMNMRVVELACNERRNSSIIRSRIAGATQSYQVMVLYSFVKRLRLIS